jgi:hypothetical protein
MSPPSSRQATFGIKIRKKNFIPIVDDTTTPDNGPSLHVSNITQNTA